MTESAFFWIFAVAWSLFFIYTSALDRRQGKLEGDLDDLRRRSGAGRD